VPEDLFVWAQNKGITVLGTGDFTHAGWLSELQDKREPAEAGLYPLKPELQKTWRKGFPGPALRRSVLCSPERSAVFTSGEEEPERSTTSCSCRTLNP
jgi:hypothetical protein